MSMQVTVLCPDGHRVNVKITKQTPLLQILEEACAKRKLDATNYGLRKENDRPHIPNLDTSLTVNFAGLPNHCKLEVVPCERSSKGQKVKVALQLEEGGRVIGDYECDETLDKIYIKAQEKLGDSIKEGNEPVIIYMRQEIIGKEAFASMSLKKLGLTGGSAVLRLIHRQPDVLVDQAGVYNMKESKGPSEEKEASNWRPMRKQENEATLKIFEQAKKESSNPSSEEISSKDIEMKEEAVPEPPVGVIQEPKKENIEVKEEETMQEEVKIDEEILEDPILNYLDDDHGTVIFKLSDRSAKIRNIIDVSDEFFELTIEDAKSILRDARKLQKDLDPEDKILMTKEMRATQKEGQKLALLNKYKRCVVRVQLPDRHVIQAFFQPGAQLSEVMENISRYIQVKENLELFSTPPKTVLDLESNLLDYGLVPAALIFLSTNKGQNVEAKWLSDSVKLSNISGAEVALSEAKVLKSKSGNDPHPLETMVNSSTNASSNSSSSASATKRPPTSVLPEKSGGSKVPRWFKPSKS